MSKLYFEYLKRKEIDNNKCYLFKSGLFYVFLDEDAKRISKITTLALTDLNKDIVKCGFPSNSLDKYMDIFNNLGLSVEIIDNICFTSNNTVNDKVIRKIREIDIDKLTPVKALNILSNLKDMLVHE